VFNGSGGADPSRGAARPAAPGWGLSIKPGGTPGLATAAWLEAWGAPGPRRPVPAHVCRLRAGERPSASFWCRRCRGCRPTPGPSDPPDFRRVRRPRGAGPGPGTAMADRQLDRRQVLLAHLLLAGRRGLAVTGSLRRTHLVAARSSTAPDPAPAPSRGPGGAAEPRKPGDATSATNLRRAVPVGGVRPVEHRRTCFNRGQGAGPRLPDQGDWGDAWSRLPRTW